MKKMIMVVTMLVGMTAFGHHGWNHWMAGNILGGLAFGLGAGLTAPRTTVVTTPVVTTPVVTTPTVVTTPVVTTPVVAAPTVVSTVPTFSYGYYNNVYCPYYDGYYYYNNAWVWGGVGIRRPIPTWIPPYRFHHGYGPRVMPHYRPAPFHRPAPLHHGPVGRPMGGHHGGRPGGMPHGGHRR